MAKLEFYRGNNTHFMISQHMMPKLRFSSLDPKNKNLQLHITNFLISQPLSHVHVFYFILIQAPQGGVKKDKEGWYHILYNLDIDITHY